MKLVKVRSLSNRPASNLSVIVQFLFGDHMPGEFIPGYSYKKGNTVYTISEDGYSIKLWTCNIAGTYPNTTEPFWTELSISTYLNSKLSKIVKKIYDPHPQMYNLTQTIGTYTIPRLNTELFNIEHTPSFMDVFYDGLLVSPDEYEVIDGEIKSFVMPVEDNVVIDDYSPCHDLSRLIRRVSYAIEMDGNTITLPTRKIQQYVSYGYDLFVNGQYVDPTQYSESVDDSGNIVITLVGNVDSMITGKNILKNNTPSGTVDTIDGLTFTVNGDKSVTVTGKATKNISFYIGSISLSDVQKSYSYNGMPGVGSESTYYTELISKQTTGDNSSTVKCYNTENGYTIDPSGVYDSLDVSLNFYEGYETDGITFYPMIRESSIESSNYEPYQEGDIINTCVANFAVSVSDNITIAHTVLTKTIEREMDSYDIDITDSGYINVYQTMAIFVDGKRVDSSKFHFSKGYLNVKSQKDYLERGSVIAVSVMSYIPTEYDYTDVNDEDRRYITESIYTVENNTRLIPIPFMNYSEDLDDFLLFNENGAFISSAKWFIDRNYVHYYPHDQGVYIGDTVNFKMVDRNQNTIMRTFILTAESDNQQKFELPFNSDDYEFKMLFYSSGCYLSPLEYSMTGNDLTLTHNMSLEPDDRLEIVAFKYAGEIGSTVMSCKRIFVNNEVSNTFKLDFQFDKAVTSFMIFANTGLYIGEKFYDISDDNILTIKGEEVYEGGWLDIVVIQSTSALTSADNILGLL